MKHSIIVFIFTVFASIDPLWAQKFTEPRIVAGKFDKWFLERLLREKLKIPYSTVTIEKFDQALIQETDGNLSEEIRRFVLKGEVLSLAGDLIEQVIVRWKGNISYSFHFTVNMPGDLTYYLKCRVIDYQKRESVYFNSCKAEFKEGILDPSFRPLNDETLKRHLSKFCRDCGLEALQKLSLVHFLRVGKSWPLNEKPYLDYKDFYDSPFLTDYGVNSDRFYFGGEDYKYYQEFDFYDFINPYFSRGLRVGITPLSNLAFPEGPDQGLLLKKESEIKTVDSTYQDDDPYCVIKEGLVIGGSRFDIWEEKEAFIFSSKLSGDLPLPHEFNQEYLLFPLDFSDGKWLTMRCFGSPLLSFGDLLEMIKGKFKLHMIN